MPVAQQAPVPVAAPEPKKPDLVSLTLRVAEAFGTPGGDDAPTADGKVVFAVEPEGRQSLSLKVRNQSGIVDNYDIGLRGIPDEWYTIMPATVYLVPFGSAGMYEQEVSIQIHPPKSPEAESRMWDLEITAYSKAHESEAGAVPAQMFIHPYEDYDAKIKPERRKSPRKAHYDVEVENKSNATATIWLSASDPDLALRYRFRKPYVKVKPGEKIQAVIDVKPHKKLWLGRATERRFELGTHLKDKDEKPDEVARMEELSAKRKRGGVKGLARSGASKAGVSGPRLNKGGLNVGPQGLQMRGPQVYKGNVSGKQVNFDNLSKLPGFKRQQGMKMPVGPLMPRQAAFVQKPFLPWWIALIIPLLILIGIILWLLWPRNITVPDVRPQADVRAAEKILKDKKLRFDKTDKKVVTDKAQIGKILDQAPSPGKKVKENTGVTVIVGVGNGKVEVPDLKGKTIKDVSTLLPKQKLEIGAIKPQDEDQEFIVRSQLPLAGQFVREGTPVNINVIKPPVKKKPSGGGDDEESAAEAKAAADAAAAAAAKGQAQPTSPSRRSTAKTTSSTPTCSATRNYRAASAASSIRCPRAASSAPSPNRAPRPPRTPKSKCSSRPASPRSHLTTRPAATATCHASTAPTAKRSRRSPKTPTAKKTPPGTSTPPRSPGSTATTTAARSSSATSANSTKPHEHSPPTTRNTTTPPSHPPPTRTYSP